jgi:hypothetical protein
MANLGEIPPQEFPGYLAHNVDVALNIFRAAPKPRHLKSLAPRVNARTKRSATSSRRTGSVTRTSVAG